MTQALCILEPTLVKRMSKCVHLYEYPTAESFNAAARALLKDPPIMLYDEPTSALDADARDRFIELLTEEASGSGAALLFVSHDGSLASHFDRSVDLAEINRARATA